MIPTEQTYGELQQAFTHFNQELFEGKIPQCLLTLQREKMTCGYFSSERFVHRDGKTKTDEIALNPAYFAVVAPLEIMQTIVHEMVHAWQYHFGEPSRRGYHNQEWADKMESIGLMPSHTGAPGGKRTGEKMSDYPILGGPFMKAYDALMKHKFQISWLDRFPPEPTALNKGSRPRPNPIEKLKDLGVMEGPAMTNEQVHDLFGDPTHLEPVNKSNRVKQRCPSCGAQAWGKPGLLLLCGEDDCGGQAFEVAITASLYLQDDEG